MQVAILNMHDPEHSAPFARLVEAKLAIVTVTFHPNLRILEEQLASLPADSGLFVVDNGSNARELGEIREIVSSRPNTILTENGNNLGIAAAINRGVAEARILFTPVDFLLLMDQDSVPEANAIEQLIVAFKRLEREGRNVGCVGPQLVDPSTGLRHGFHAIRGWRWVRSIPLPDSQDSTHCMNLNGSGTLMRMELYEALGGLEDAFFIDHVDTEWSFRVQAAGLELFGIPQSIFSHSMGERGLRFWWFGWHLWPQRSPQRHYYLFRNACRLLRRDYVPRVWKFWAVIKLLLTVLVCGLFEARRVDQLRHMFNGVYHSFRKAK